MSHTDSHVSPVDKGHKAILGTIQLSKRKKKERRSWPFCLARKKPCDSLQTYTGGLKRKKKVVILLLLGTVAVFSKILRREDDISFLFLFCLQETKKDPLFLFLPFGEGGKKESHQRTHPFPSFLGHTTLHATTDYLLPGKAVHTAQLQSKSFSYTSYHAIHAFIMLWPPSPLKVLLS